MNDETKPIDIPSELKNFYSRYDESFQFGQTRKRRQVAQIVLLNNLQRGDENIASTLLITLFNRILSNLYDDKMQVKFIPGEEIDQKKVNSLNILAQNDYREMDKGRLDYDWDWDTLFFGRGYMETLRFDKIRKIMQPNVINPLVFGYDPFFEDSKQWRYYWKWITKSWWDIQKLIDKGIITGIKSPKEIASGIDPYLWDYKIRREQAKLVTPQANDTYQGDVFQILEFFGYADYDIPQSGISRGDKCVFWIDRDFTKILYAEKLDLKDAPDGKDSEWPIVVKEAFREPHSSVVFSVADLLEDKHRARSVLLNLAFISAKDKANPLYQYVPDNIKDLSQLFNRQIGQHIPVTDVSSSIAPLNTANPMDNGLNAFMQMLSQEANDPVGTGMSLAPAKKGKASATENAIQQQLNDLAQSLQSKVMQFGEEEFWKDWYHRYRRYSKAGDEKIATITGVKGMTFEKIDLGDIHTKYPPGVLIFSAKDAEYKELVLRRDLMQMYPQFESSLDPDGMRMFNKYVFFPKFLQDPSMIDALFPETIDELKANAENDSLADDKFMPADVQDDHTQHILVHMMAKKTWATWTHIGMHQELLALQKKQEMAQGQPSPDQKDEQNPDDKGKDKGQKGKPQKQNPMQATAPMGQQQATPLPAQAPTM
jgi:hypothetical protein